MKLGHGCIFSCIDMALVICFRPKHQATRLRSTLRRPMLIHSNLARLEYEMKVILKYVRKIGLVLVDLGCHQVWIDKNVAFKTIYNEISSLFLCRYHGIFTSCPFGLHVSITKVHLLLSFQTRYWYLEGTFIFVLLDYMLVL